MSTAADWARSGATRPPRSLPALVALALAGLLLTLGFAALGVWQVERRAWKLDLIERTGQRLAAPPVAVPGPGDWPRVTRARDEYRRVRLTGHFLAGAPTLVTAVTDQGPGFWAMAPLRENRGFVVLVNRGFVPAGTQAAAPAGPVSVVGLVRMSEPGGGPLRSNDPASGRWYSRDVAAIAAARGLGRVAPFFVDADAAPNPGGYPRGGLTVVSFPNNHLVYALTWFALAMMVAGATVFVIRHEWRARAAR